MLPKEMMSECIGKYVWITVFDSAVGYSGKITAVEDNWLKIEHKGEVKIVNGDMIKEIRICTENEQKRLDAEQQKYLEKHR